MTDEPPQLSDEPNGYYFDRLGVAISQREWVSLRERHDYYRIGSTTVGDIWISTVWMGLDHGFSFAHPEDTYVPIIFETMVFNNAGEDRRMDLEMERYSTEAQARDGHEQMVALVMAMSPGLDRVDA